MQRCDGIIVDGPLPANPAGTRGDVSRGQMTAVALPARGGGFELLQDDQVRPCNRERRGYINLAVVWTLDGALESLSYFWPLSTHNPS